MSETQLIVSDLDFATSVGDSRMYGLDIKEEIVRDDDILLLTADEMEVLGNEQTNFQIVEEMVDSNRLNNDSYNINGLDEQQMMHMMTDENFAKYPIELSQMCKFDPTKTENSSHFVKFKIQDGKQSKVWECGICSKEFGHQYTLMRHLPTHTDERKFQCNTCGKAFRQMSTLSQHRAIHSSDRPYICEVCQKTFNRVSTLISHRKTHTGHKPHCCHLCNKAFHQKGNLRNHIFTHTNERPYKCDICSKGFNQMSNLMCHKLKAHQRADKPRYICQICGKDFQKRMGLRNHEQYQHGVPGNESASSSSAAPTRVKYTNGVLVDPINTAAMQHALATNQIPFALLRPLNGIPVLVRVLSAGDKQMLVPATAEDLKKHGQITICKNSSQCRPQDDDDVDENKENMVALDSKPFEDDDTTSVKHLGTTVQIKIPVVATVIQKCGKDGNMSMAVESPGPNNEDGGVSSNNFYVTTTDENASEVHFVPSFAAHEFNNVQFEDNGNMQPTQIQFINDCDQLLQDESGKNTFFGNDFVHDLPSTGTEILDHIKDGNILNIAYDSNGAPIYEVLNKSESISIPDTNNIVETENVLYRDVNMVENFVL